MNLKKNLLVGCLYRDGSVRIPRGHDALEIGDRVVIVTTNRAFVISTIYLQSKGVRT